MSYVKLLVGYNTVVPVAWVNNMDKAFDALSPESKAAFVLEQSVMLSFMKKLYNGYYPILIRNYANTIYHYYKEVSHINDINPSLGPAFKQDVAYIEELWSDNVPANTKDLLERLKAIIDINDFPHISDFTGMSFYKPYLEYYGSNGNTVGISEAVSIPSFALRGSFVYVGFETKMIGYHYTEAIKEQLNKGPYPIPYNCIFSFLAGYNWKDSNLQTLLGLLSTYCFDLDLTVQTTGSYAWIYKLVKSVITGYKSSVSPYVDSLSLSFDDTALRRIFISFIVDLRKVHGLKLDDAHILAKLMGNDNKEDIDNLKSYLEAVTASEVSVEAHKAFRSSIFSSFEELDISQRSVKKKDKMNVSLQKECFLNPSNIQSLKETLDALYKHDVRITEPAPLKGNKHADESDTMSMEADAFQLGNVTKQSEADDKFTLDTKDADGGSDVGATGSDDNTGTESDAGKDPSVAENGEQAPSNGPEPGKPETPDTHVPDLPEVSDKKGVKLELSSSESTDTVFYRLELKTFINSVLANPPKALSVEKIEILKKIKAFWINTLAPQCVHDILNTVIRLPKMFRIHTSKKR